ncbi:MAG TPA: hypothetical protein VK760_09315, partial [Candidatus Acidoferrales bacterium]|jgi:hypothetical protein|nr:hypothetical protein [Candidatus Acidoferrales bacterium]
MSSDHAAMYQVPEGSSLEIKGGPVLHYTAWDSAQRTDLTAAFAADFTFMPSVLAAEPQEITIPGRQKKILHIKARIGPSNLAWTLTNVPNWLVVSRTSGVGDTDVSLEAQGGERGTIAYLNIDTRPAASAGSVERGPLVVRVRKP